LSRISNIDSISILGNKSIVNYGFIFVDIPPLGLALLKIILSLFLTSLAAKQSYSERRTLVFYMIAIP
jgi:hypothetical protein